MQDYEVTGINQSEKVTHFALFADCHPTMFETAMKEENGAKYWMRKLMQLNKMIHGSFLIFQKGRKLLE